MGGYLGESRASVGVAAQFGAGSRSLSRHPCHHLLSSPKFMLNAKIARDSHVGGRTSLWPRSSFGGVRVVAASALLTITGAGISSAQEGSSASTCFLIVPGSHSEQLVSSGAIPCDCKKTKVVITPGDGGVRIGSDDSVSGAFCTQTTIAYPPYHELQPGGNQAITQISADAALVTIGSCAVKRSSILFGLIPTGCSANCVFVSESLGGFNLYGYAGTCLVDPPEIEASVATTFGVSPW